MSEWIYNSQLNQSFKQTDEGMIEWRPKSAPKANSSKKRWKARPPARSEDVYFVHTYFDFDNETITLRFYEWSDSEGMLVKRKPDEVFDYNLRGTLAGSALTRPSFCNYRLFTDYYSYINERVSEYNYGLRLSKTQKTIVQTWGLRSIDVTHVPNFRQLVIDFPEYATFLSTKSSTSFCGVTMTADLLSVSDSSYRYILTVYDAIKKVNVIEQEITTTNASNALNSAQYDHLSESVYILGEFGTTGRTLMGIYKLVPPFSGTYEWITINAGGNAEREFFQSIARTEEERLLLGSISGTLFSMSLRGFSVDSARRQLIYWYRSKGFEEGYLVAVSYNLDSGQHRLLAVTPSELLGPSFNQEATIVFQVSDIYQVSDEYILVIMVDYIYKIEISPEVNVTNVAPPELVALSNSNLIIKATTDKPL